MSNILQNIFIDYYEHILYELHPRQTEIENISKMIHCGDPSYGGAFFACPDCGKLKFVPFRCKSRFCPSCGNMYNQKRYNLIVPYTSNAFQSKTSVFARSSSNFKIRGAENPSQAAKKAASCMAK